MSYKNYQYVWDYDKNQSIDEEFIKNALLSAWLYTPSKNNFMPYKVHVLGSEFSKHKEELYWLCLGNEIKANGNNFTTTEELKKYEKISYLNLQGCYPAYHNIVDAPYVLIFTQRIEDSPNQFQQEQIDMGYVFEQMAKGGQKRESARKNAYLEIGMFSANFATECLANGIDISHTLCFPGDRKDWTQEYFNFLDNHPILVMTVGKAKNYRFKEVQIKDPKPDFDRIVNILKRD